MAVFLVFVGVLTILIITWYIKYYSYEKYLKKIPGPVSLPLIGNAIHIIGLRQKPELLSGFLELQQVYGDMVKLRMGFDNPALLICDIKALEFVLSSTKLIEKGYVYKFFHNWLGTGLLTSTGEKWKLHRKMLTPAFHFKILEEFVDVFKNYTDTLISKLNKEIGKSSIDIFPYITLCSLDIICATSMGTNVNAQTSSDSEYAKSVFEMCKIVINRIISPFKSQDFLYYLSKDYKKEKQALEVLHNYTKSVIGCRKKELKDKSAVLEGRKFDDIGKKRKLTFLDSMLQYKFEGNAISDEEIREEVDTFMFEGHDTTTSGISFTLYCLATNKDIQEKVMDELNTIFGNDRDREATYRDLQDMKYLEMVIKESMRLYPPVPIFSRNVDEDIIYDDIVLPKGVTLTIFPFGTHRDPRIYPDPERFDPERFTLENQSKRSPYVYIPFSAGPRNCIGQKFAMLELKAVVSKILRNFELLPSIPEHTLKLITAAILKSETGVRIRLLRRKY